MKYKFDTSILEENREFLKEALKNNKTGFDQKFAEIENILYTDMRKYYNDLKDEYTYRTFCSDYHDIMATIVQNSRESDKELTKLLQDFIETLKV